MVAELLNKLLIEQTKSRPRHSNDNGLAESSVMSTTCRSDAPTEAKNGTGSRAPIPAPTLRA